MKQDSTLTRSLADAQELHARVSQSPAFGAPKVLYRLYTERTLVNPASYINRYFDGATYYYGTGMDARTIVDTEEALIIEIVSSKPDALTRIVSLASDIRRAGRQVSVLVTQQPVTTFEITALTEGEPYRLAGVRPLDRPEDSPRYNRDSKAQAHRFPVLSIGIGERS